MRPRTVAIVPSAGYGRRLGLKKKKPFVLLNDRPLVSYALKTLNGCRAVDRIIVASEKNCVKSLRALVNKFRFKKVTDVVVGGKTRAESVENCLKIVDTSFDIVLIHDGARPFVEESMIESSIRLAKKYGGCIVAVPENDTVKLAGRDLFIKKTLDRSRLFRAQTPQAFRRSLIQKAYAGIKKGVTDDSGLAEKTGVRVKILEGSYKNIKITTKEDLKFAEVLL